MKTIKSYLASFLIKRCPVTGKMVGVKSNKYVKVLFPLIGIAAILWFLLRVIPKPSRAAYPCQKVAATIGGSFLLYLFGVISSMALYEQIRLRINKRTALVYLCGLAFLVSMGFAAAQVAKPEFVPNITPPEGGNNPMGIARGFYPGRVVWTQDFNVTNWDEKNGFWWDDKNTNQIETEKMMSVTLRNLTGTKTDKEAWQKLFSFNNQQNGKGNKGYKKGEKIVIKLNMNATSKPDQAWTDQGYPSPQMVYSLISQLIDAAGVSGEDIIITDPSRYIGSEISNKLHSNSSPDYQKLIFEESTVRNQQGYRAAEPDSSALIWFNMPDGKKFRMCLPKSYTEATYIINYSLVRPHRVFGITSAAKNNFGSVWSFEAKKFNPTTLHAFALWDYPTPNKLGDAHTSPVLLGHKINNSKTILYLSDGLYAAYNQTGKVKRMSSFNNDWFSSLLMSQDPVALESVVYDFISNEPNLISGNPSFNGNQDNQFQECALANNPPSKIKYDPENDGTGLQSLGVHEHWNNPKERKYSGNLGKSNGIELVSLSL